MDYQELEQDLDHLLVTSRTKAIAEYECKLIKEAGKSLEEVVTHRRWLAQMQQHANDDARRYVDWMRAQMAPRQLQEQSDTQIEDKASGLQRIAQYFTNGSSEPHAS